eukprot:gene10243-11942_t
MAKCVQHRKYQALHEVDASLFDSDGSPEESPFKVRVKHDHLLNTNLATVAGFFVFVWHWLRYTLLGDFRVALRYVHKNSRKNIKGLLLGLLTVFLVVLFISFLQNLIQASPIVFLKLSEDQAGELDLVITGDASSASVANSSLTSTDRVGAFKAALKPQHNSLARQPRPSLMTATAAHPNIKAPNNGLGFSLSSFNLLPYFMNSTLLTNVLDGAKTVHGVAPRWLSLGDLAPISSNTSSSLILLVMNSTLEHDLGLGRGWTHPPLVGNQAHVSSAFLRRIGVKPNANQTVNMHIDFIDILDRLGVSNSFPSFSDVEARIEDYIGIPIPAKVNISDVVAILNITNPTLVTQIIAILGDGISPDASMLYPLIVLRNLYNDVRAQLVIERPLVVVDGIDEPGGKYPTALGNVAVLESEFVDTIFRERFLKLSHLLDRNLTTIESILRVALPYIAPDYNISQVLDQLNSFTKHATNFAKNFKLNEYSMMSVVMLRDRVKIYISPDAELKLSMTAFTNEVAMRIGYSYPATFTTPISSVLSLFKYIRLSLNQIFNVVAAVLITLGALMIYSLLLSDVEGKTFEYGMLRAQGLRHYALIILLLTQAIYFSVPGILCGLLLGWACFAVVAHFIYAYVILPVDLTFYSISIVSGVLIGFCLPIVANIAPIQRALSRTLRDALDVYHQVKSETMVKIMKLEEVGIDALQTLLSVLAVAVGFTVYYLIPLSFIFRNLSLFFGILTGILLGMLFGMSMLAQSIQSFVERAVLFLLVWGNDRRSLYSLVRKNLASHSSRNSKTATMFTISLTFIIFTGCVFRLQGHNIQQLTELGVGSDIAIVATSSRSPLPEMALRAFLDNEISNNTDTSVDGYTVVTFPLDSVMNIRSTHLSTLATDPSVYIRVYGVEEHFLSNVYTDFYSVSEMSKSLTFPTVQMPDDSSSRTKKHPDIVASLYTNAGKDLLPMDGDKIDPPPSIVSANSSIIPSFWLPDHFDNNYVYLNYSDAIISEAFRSAAGADTTTPFDLSITFDTYPGMRSTISLLAKPQSMVSMMPAFFYSAYAESAGRSPLLVSTDRFLELMQLVYSLTDDPNVILPAVPPKYKFLIRLKPGTSQSAREYIINGCKNFLKSDSIQVLDTEFLLETTSTAVMILDIFFYTVSSAAIVLCFFMLWVSFAANIHENSWEFGVLRSIGLTSFQVTRIYMYEALVLIISSVVLGLIIGLGIAITLTLQFDLFTQLPFSFQFPYFWFFGVLAASIGTAVFVSVHASTEYRTRQIASVLKGK